MNDESSAESAEAHARQTELNVCRLLAFLSIKKLALLSPPAFLDSVLKVCGWRGQNLTFSLKGSYSMLLQMTKVANIYHLPLLRFMVKCLMELFALNATTTYKHAFVAIRQIAVILRNAMTNRSDSATALIYNWSTCYCIDLWCRVLGDLGKVQSGKGEKEMLRGLIYPLTQVTLGIIKFQMSAEYHPLRLHLTASLNHLAGSTRTFIPVSSFLLEIIDAEYFQERKLKGCSLNPLDFTSQFRAPKGYLNTRLYRDDLLDETFTVFIEYLTLHSTSIWFPDMCAPILFHLKKVAKAGTDQKLNRQLNAMIEKIKATVKLTMDRREAVDFTPSDLNKCQAFSDEVEVSSTPLSQYLATMLLLKKNRTATVVRG